MVISRVKGCLSVINITHTAVSDVLCLSSKVNKTKETTMTNTLKPGKAIEQIIEAMERAEREPKLRVTAIDIRGDLVINVAEPAKTAHVDTSRYAYIPAKSVVLAGIPDDVEDRKTTAAIALTVAAGQVLATWSKHWDRILKSRTEPELYN